MQEHSLQILQYRSRQSAMDKENPLECECVLMAFAKPVTKPALSFRIRAPIQRHT